MPTRGQVRVGPLGLGAQCGCLDQALSNLFMSSQDFLCFALMGMQLLHNHTIVHLRTAYEDYEVGLLHRITSQIPPQCFHGHPASVKQSLSQASALTCCLPDVCKHLSF